ncbi:hypothetical protein KAT92_01975 [Candidatus Babeliales bacterium]|nr:hypothetical protein [Candidatus Babeliales bacterium]
MEQLHELEKRVLDIIQKNKEMLEENGKLRDENSRLLALSRQLETSVLKRGESTKALESEKNEIKSTLDELIQTINSLQASE